jgi:hypothetical protein
MNRLSRILSGLVGSALLAALLAGCREGQKNNPLPRATTTEPVKPAVTGTNVPANTRTFDPDR